MNELKNKKWMLYYRILDSDKTLELLDVLNALSAAGIKSEDIKIVSIVIGGFGSNTTLYVYYYHDKMIY